MGDKFIIPIGIYSFNSCDTQTIYDDHTLIGFIVDCGYDEHEMEIGYVMDPVFWNHGYATEAVRAVIQDLRELGFSKVKAAFFEGNTASYRVMEKCGIPRNEHAMP